jgi:hypothetical protein
LPALQLLPLCHAEKESAPLIVKGFDILALKCNAVSIGVTLGAFFDPAHLDKVAIPGINFTITLIRRTRLFWAYILVRHLVVPIQPN